MSISLVFIRWAGVDPDASRLEELLSRDDLSPKEKAELDKLTENADIIIMR